MVDAARSFTKASSLYDKNMKRSESKRAESRSLQAEFWLESDFSKRSKILDPIDVLCLESAKASERSRDWASECESLTDFLEFFRESANVAVEFDALNARFEQAVRAGRSLVVSLEAHNQTERLVDVLDLMVWLLAVEGQVLVTPDEFQSFAEETKKLQDKLEKVSQKLGTPYAICRMRQSAGHLAFNIHGDPAKASQEYESGITLSRNLGDTLLLGRLLWLNSQAVYWSAGSESDPSKKRESLKKSLAYALEATRNLEVSLQTSELTAAYANVAKCYIELANLELDPDKKGHLLRQAIEEASKGVNYESGTWAWMLAAFALAGAMNVLSKLESAPQRIRLLQDALEITKQTVLAVDRLNPHFWNTVSMRYRLATIKSELASVDNNQANKREMLIQAVSDMEACLERGANWATNSGFIQRLAGYDETYGDLLFQLYNQTRNADTAQKAIKAYESSASRFTNTKRFSASAPVRWKIARIYDVLGEFNLATSEFRKAAEDYRKGVSEIPGSASTFQDLSRYMDAWGHIEAARYDHGAGEYSLASENYVSASDILKTTQTWSHLESLFSARSLLETAEGLSHEEYPQKAILKFQSAANSFRKATLEIESKSSSSTQLGEVQQLQDWLKLIRQRESYCLARLELEEARASDRKGDKQSSASRFQAAADIFSALVTKESDLHDRGELEAMAKFCHAWALMKEAETKASPEFYLQAASAFMDFDAIHAGESIKRFALGNASVCKALAAGTRFRQSREPHFYSELKKHLEAAADHYSEAGFKRTSKWTRATQRLFDALIFISNAESAPSPNKKRELYHLAEKHLELAAKLYGEAGFTTRKEEVLHQIEQVREEKSILLTPVELLSQIPTAAGTSLVLIPRGRAEPIGLERFEEAYMAGEIVIPQREAALGSIVTLELDMANIGKAVATLVKLETVLPTGLELEDSDLLSEEGVLDLKGRRLEHLKTYQVRMPIKASQAGSFEFHPRLSYVDDRGNYRSCSFPTKTLSIIEVGQPQKPISLEAGATPSAPRLPLEFRFETLRAEEVFRLLVREFVRDYMSKRLFVDKAGWRSLMDLVNETKIPRSALYGPGGRDGPVLQELQRRGLIETRIFPKERGRGGSVKKVRVAYDNAIVKRIVEQTVIQNK